MIPGFLPEMHIMVLQTHRNLKGEVRLTLSSTFPSQQDIAYSISCSKAETEIDLLQDGGKIIKERTSITTLRELFRTFATFHTRQLSHWYTFNGL
jgi:hypothetical protein